MPFHLTTTAFTSGGDIPQKFTCDGANVSPLLAWTEPPSGTKALALIMDDPDAPAGTFTHWLVYDLPAATSGLPENVPNKPDLESGGHQGRNNFGRTGYAGPCPPSGKPHRYFFRLYALNAPSNLKGGADKDAVVRSMSGHLLGQAELVGRYGR